MIIEVIWDDRLEYRYESDHVPVIGDRVTFADVGYRVTERTWRLDGGTVELWTERE